VYGYKQKLVPGFTEKYNIHQLVFYEETSDVNAAIAREKHLSLLSHSYFGNPAQQDMLMSKCFDQRRRSPSYPFQIARSTSVSFYDLLGFKLVSDHSILWRLK
jgi:hypothetical protein